MKLWVLFATSIAAAAARRSGDRILVPFVSDVNPAILSANGQVARYVAFAYHSAPPIIVHGSLPESREGWGGENIICINDGDRDFPLQEEPASVQHLWGSWRRKLHPLGPVGSYPRRLLNDHLRLRKLPLYQNLSEVGRPLLLNRRHLHQ
jgi:hypothetical protein